MMKTQEKRRSKDFWIFVGVCAGIMLIGVAALYFNQQGVGINLILYGTLSIAIAMLLGKEHYFQDERSKRINEQAASKAYIVTAITMILMLAFGKTIPGISGASFDSVIAIIFLPGLFCLMIFIWYYRRKGDAE